MKILVTCYSRSGVTRKACEKLAEFLDEGEGCSAEFHEIVDLKDRSGASGYVIAGKDALLKNEADIADFLADPEDFDLVVIGSPVWAFTVAPAVRTFANRYFGKINQAAFIFTMQGSGDRRASGELSRLLKKQPLARVTLLDKHVKRDSSAEFLVPLRDFASRLKVSADRTED